MDLSIIVPVFNVEEYIRPCMESLFLQGLDENCFEVIIVNDGTEDRSIEVIQDIIEQHKNITVINQENQGLSIARNNGIAIAKGKYILMPDSDDLLIDYSLKPLLEIAIKTGVDMVVADFLMMYNEEIANFHGVNQKDITVMEKTGEQLTLEDLNARQCYVWRFLFRKKFILDNNISFIPGIFFQDVPFTHECCIKANRCIKTSQLLNIYRKGRKGAATSSFSGKKGKDLCTAIAKTWDLTHKNALPLNIQKKIQDNIFTLSSLLVYVLAINPMKVAEKVSILVNLKKEVPDLFFKNGAKQRVFTFLLWKMPKTILFIRKLYGILIEESIRPYYRRFLTVKRTEV